MLWMYVDTFHVFVPISLSISFFLFDTNHTYLASVTKDCKWNIHADITSYPFESTPHHPTYSLYPSSL